MFAKFLLLKKLKYSMLGNQDEYDVTINASLCVAVVSANAAYVLSRKWG